MQPEKIKKSSTHSEALPILLTTEVLVFHGSMAGCIAAYTCAHRGQSTVLVSSACSIPHEMVVCRRPWITPDELQCLPEPFRKAFVDSQREWLANGELLVNLAQLAVRIEDLLLDVGVRIFYGMTPCGVTSNAKGNFNGIVVGGKFGLNALVASTVMDASPMGTVAALAGCPVHQRTDGDGEIDVTLSAKINVSQDTGVELDELQKRTAAEKQSLSTEWLEEAFIDVEGVPELINGRIELHGPYAEIRLKSDVSEKEQLTYASLSNRVRNILFDIGMSISKQRKRDGLPTLLIHRFSGSLLIQPLVRVNTGAVPNLYLCSSAADVSEDQARRWADPFLSISLATESVSAIEVNACVDQPDPTAISTALGCPSGAHGQLVPNHLVFRSSDAAALHAIGDSQPLSDIALPVLTECDVLVAGAGTSGVPAALEAARAGASTILLEHQDDVGGTHTVGGVGNYWFGRETPFQVEYNGECDALAKESGLAMEIAMRKVLTNAGVFTVTGCCTIGVLMDGNRLAGLVVATDRGPGAILGRVVLDATGDADIAAWAGAPFEYGNGRDAWTLWASFANFNEEKRTASRQYESSIEIRDPYDFTRTIITGRRRQGMWKSYSHEMPQLYVAPRESRRLVGDATLTYGDILAGTSVSDLVTVCESNFDIKGVASSDLIRSGLIWSWNTYKTYSAAVPFRAMLPQGIENLLVIGKSYSATHDAIALARMQRDMGCLGASGGMAAAEAASAGEGFRALNIDDLQKKWIERGTLLSGDLKKMARPSGLYTAKDAVRDAESLFKSSTQVQKKLARLSQSSLSIPPLLDVCNRLEDSPLKLKVGRMLCFLGDTSAVPYLLRKVAEQIEIGLPTPHRRTIAIPPEHGWAGDPAYSLYAIGLTRHGSKAGPLLCAVAEKLVDDEAVYASKIESPFEYVRMICSVAERHPGPAMLPALNTLYKLKSLRNLSIRFDADMRLAVDSVLERRAYLELCLGRALARSADRRGYEILLSYLDDVRGTLARSARDELSDLLGESTTSGRTEWESAIDRTVATSLVKPYTERIH